MQTKGFRLRNEKEMDLSKRCKKEGAYYFLLARLKPSITPNTCESKEGT